ncbi:hypothetical protein [Neorhizobium sp. T6_25]|uniref:hypothetical protein n=1 Tax=Neorhizobium sp. T6_25 TaxID=2093833 RepID=UPI000CFA24E2|nr:hypothetical protein [Neorhizobium sp. T6_25]
MLPDIFFPSSVLLLKFVYKLFIEQEVKALDVFRALCAFPLDMAFLSFSFFAAFVYSIPPQPSAAFSQKDVLSAFLIFLVLTVIVTALCRKTDKAMVAAHYWKSGMLAVFNYCIAVSLLIGTLAIGGAL